MANKAKLSSGAGPRPDPSEHSDPPVIAADAPTPRAEPKTEPPPKELGPGDLVPCECYPFDKIPQNETVRMYGYDVVGAEGGKGIAQIPFELVAGEVGAGRFRPVGAPEDQVMLVYARQQWRNAFGKPPDNDIPYATLMEQVTQERKGRDIAGGAKPILRQTQRR